MLLYNMQASYCAATVYHHNTLPAASYHARGGGCHKGELIKANNDVKNFKAVA